MNKKTALIFSFFFLIVSQFCFGMRRKFNDLVFQAPIEENKKVFNFSHWIEDSIELKTGIDCVLGVVCCPVVTFALCCCPKARKRIQEETRKQMIKQKKTIK